PVADPASGRGAVRMVDRDGMGLVGPIDGRAARDAVGILRSQPLHQALQVPVLRQPALGNEPVVPHAVQGPPLFSQKPARDVVAAAISIVLGAVQGLVEIADEMGDELERIASSAHTHAWIAEHSGLTLERGNDAITPPRVRATVAAWIERGGTI